MKKIIITIFLLFLFITNCIHYTKSKYKLDDIYVINSKITKSYTISIQPFKNTWIDNPYHRGKKPDKTGNRQILGRFNVAHYKNKDIGSQLAEIFAKHLNQTKAFKKSIL